jgi:hypothetical protein
MEREIPPSIFLHYLLCALCVRPFWYGRRQADNPFPPKNPANRPGAASLATKITWPNAMRFFPYRETLRARLSTASTTGYARAPNTNHRCHFRNRSRRAAAGMGGNGLSVWRLPCDKGRTHTALMRYATKKKLWEFLFSSVGSTLQSFPPLKCDDFMKCVRELWKTL